MSEKRIVIGRAKRDYHKQVSIRDSGIHIWQSSKRSMHFHPRGFTVRSSKVRRVHLFAVAASLLVNVLFVIAICLK